MLQLVMKVQHALLVGRFKFFVEILVLILT